MGLGSSPGNRRLKHACTQTEPDGAQESPGRTGARDGRKQLTEQLEKLEKVRGFQGAPLPAILGKNSRGGSERAK